MVVPFFSTCSLLNPLVSPFIESLLIVKALEDSYNALYISSALRLSDALFYTGFVNNCQLS